MDKPGVDKRTFVSLPHGCSLQPLYQRCPRCDFDLNQVPKSLVDQIQVDYAKGGASKAKRSFVARAHKVLTPYFLYLRSMWMVLPFAATKKDTAERNKQSGLGRKVGKQHGTGGKKNNRAE